MPRPDSSSRVRPTSGAPSARRLLAEAVLLEHREWVDANPAATLGDLRARIAAAAAQCEGYVLSGDPPIADRAAVPAPLSEELALWPPAGTSGEAPRHFSDAGVLLAGYAWRLAVLEGMLGGDFPVAELAAAGRR